MLYVIYEHLVDKSNFSTTLVGTDLNKIPLKSDKGFIESGMRS